MDLVYDVASRHFRDRFAALVAVLDADPCVEEAQVVVNFRYRAHSRARVFRRGFLIYRDSRREALDLIYVWLAYAV